MFFKAFIFLLLFWAQLCYSQQAASVWYDTDNRLPQNSVKDIIKDRYGFIWLSMENGLVRYDGYNFVSYNHLKLKNNRFSVFFGNIEKDSIYNFTAYTENIVLLGQRNVSILHHQNNCIKRALHENKSYGLFVKNGIQEKTDHKDFFLYFDKNSLASVYHDEINNKVHLGTCFFKDSNYSKKESLDFTKTRPYVLNINPYYVIVLHLPSLQSKHIFYKDSCFNIVRVLTSLKGKYIYKTINTNVKYLFYQTLIFKFFIVLLLALIVFTLFKIRLKRQIVKKKELEEIIAIRTRKLSKTVSKLEYTKEQLRKESVQQKKLLETISHDIITPIKYLSFTAQKLYETDEHDRYIQKKYLENFYKSSVEFYNFVKTLKEYAEIYNIPKKNEIYNIYEVVEAKKALFKAIAKEQNTLIINNIKDPTYSKNNQNVIAVIIHNLIDNAVKNTTNGIIELSSLEDSRNFFLEVKDTGKGMSKEQMTYYEKLQDNIENEKLVLQKYSLGLHLILQLLMMINGKIEFKNNTPNGTIISIKIKKQKDD